MALSELKNLNEFIGINRELCSIVLEDNFLNELDKKEYSDYLRNYLLSIHLCLKILSYHNVENISINLEYLKAIKDKDTDYKNYIELNGFILIKNRARFISIDKPWNLGSNADKRFKKLSNFNEYLKMIKDVRGKLILNDNMYSRGQKAISLHMNIHYKHINMGLDNLFKENELFKIELVNFLIFSKIHTINHQNTESNSYKI